jgi:hypothetical protein
VWVELTNLRTHSGILEYLNILVEHVPRAVEMGDHIDLVIGGEVFNQGSGELGFTEGYDSVITEGVNALAKDQ